MAELSMRGFGTRLFTGTLSLGTLASEGVVKDDFLQGPTQTQGFRISKLRIAFSLRGKTVSEGPVLCGISCNASSTSLIKARYAISQGTTSKLNDPSIGSSVYVRALGWAHREASGAIAIPSDNTFMDVKLNWSIPEDSALNFWAMNLDTGVLTTGMFVAAVGEIYGVWLND